MYNLPVDARDRVTVASSRGYEARRRHGFASMQKEDDKQLTERLYAAGWLKTFLPDERITHPWPTNAATDGLVQHK